MISMKTEILQKRRKKCRNNTINILYLDKSRFYGGAEEGLKLLLKELDRDRYEPWLCLDYEMPQADKFKGCNVKILFRTSGLSWWSKEKWSSPILGLGYIERAVYAIKLMSSLKKIRPSIVHINLFRNKTFFDILVSRILGAKVVAHVRSLATQTSFSRRVLNLCDAIICTSEAVKHDIENRRPKSLVRRIYNGIDFRLYQYKGSIDEARLALNLPVNSQVLSSIAILDPRKGHETAIRAIPIIRKNIPEIILVIAGTEISSKKQTETERLKEIAIELKVESNVFFLGHCSDMAALYAASDIVLALSIDGEAFGRVPLEASIAKKPIIATAVGATSELIEHGKSGILIQPNDIDALSKAVIDLLEDRSRGFTLVKQAEKIARQLFDSSACASAIADLYDELLE